MAIPVGGVIRFAINGRINGQQTVTSFYYRVSAGSTLGTVVEDLDAALDFFTTSATAPYGAFLAAVPVDWTNEFNSAQEVLPVLSVNRKLTLVDPGTRGAATTPNLSAVITKGTDFGGRNMIGSWHLPGVAAGDQVGGIVDNALLGAMSAFGSRSLNALVDPASGLTLEPVLYHRNAANPLASTFTKLTRTIPQDTIRVMRRRTVGVGK